MLRRLVLNTSEVRRLLRGESEYSGVRDDLARRGQAIASAAGPGMETTNDVGANRARTNVWTATYEAIVNEATSKALTRALDAGRR